MLEEIRHELQYHAIPPDQRKGVFFKTGVGDYAEHDKFLGVPVPRLREIAKKHHALDVTMLITLLQSSINEERLLALIIMVARYQKGDAQCQEELFKLYQCHIKHINNWNLVDASAHLIVGAYLYHKDKAYLEQLAISPMLWERRIAIVATWYFIRQNEFDWTLKLAETLITDKEDLIHKAVGWMLREMGKKDDKPLLLFLDKHASQMPRTMLRYAIERLPQAMRMHYMK